MYFTFLLCNPSRFAERALDHSRQFILLESLFAGIPNAFLDQFAFGRSLADFCVWETSKDHFQTSCRGNVLTRLCFLNVRCGNFRIGFVPPSVRKLRICRSYQRYPTETRLFPREGVVVDLSENALYGEVDLTALPVNLEALNLMHNSLSGELNLLHLPRRLRKLFLAVNSFCNEVVFVANVPSSLELIDLPKNEIRQVEALTADDAKFLPKVRIN